MGAGILPITWNNGEIYFLFGKENQYADTPGWSDFGGGTDNNETPRETAIREAGEELTGFLGTDVEVSRLLKRVFLVENEKYTMHLFYYPYDPYLTKYYNNNQRFLQKNLDPGVIKKTKIFEKAEIRWVPFSQLKKMLPQVRSYFQKTVKQLLSKRQEIETFFSTKSIKSKNKTLKKRI